LRRRTPARAVHPGYQPSLLGLPLGIHFVIHFQGGCLINTHHHGFALMPPIDEVVHDVLRHGIEPVIPGDQVVALAQQPLDLLFAIRIEVSLVDDLVDFLI